MLKVKLNPSGLFSLLTCRHLLDYIGKKSIEIDKENELNANWSFSDPFTKEETQKIKDISVAAHNRWRANNGGGFPL